ncbi:uncharacterized protein LOC129720373 [Wyeomyia smithii]|uniref:uncharacterized protein LOC129720373 n=1 Tax=Wyeomyia smithii TaxID=174621 RepID=UPI002467B626|nr:uncharacterized protein LOC129720373 [Wyeomyia smithii]
MYYSINNLIEEANRARQKVAHLMGETKLERKFYVLNSKVASLYCLPKIHKNPVAMRPICSNICTPTEKMAAWLVDEMKRYPVIHGKSVNNSVDSVEKLKGLVLRRGEILVSFDVTSLFPNVPVTDALCSLRRHLERYRVPPNHVEAYLAVAEVCMNQNFFTFRGKFYKQTFGLSMGDKLSPLLANVFMSDFEVDLEKERLFPRVWWRYVDDIFATVKERQLAQTLELLNSKHTSIKFTVEKESEGKLPFLDLTITRKEDNSVKFSVYRKPTSTNRYITCDSNHYGSQKQAEFHSMAHRLYSIPMEKEDFKAERKKIHEAAYLNGYDEEFVNKILRKHERKRHRRNATTFFPKLTNTIQNDLKQHGFWTAYKSNHTLKDLLCSLKDKIPRDEMSGIYEIPCKSCPAIYIGQTRRKFKVRLKEHKNAVDNDRPNESSVAVHSKENNHVIDWDNEKLKKCVSKPSHLNAWESMFIETAEKPLMNEDDAPITSALFQSTKQKII